MLRSEGGMVWYDMKEWYDARAVWHCMVWDCMMRYDAGVTRYRQRGSGGAKCEGVQRAWQLVNGWSYKPLLV